MNFSAVLGLFFYLVVFYLIGAYTEYNLNPSEWPSWLRGTSLLAPFILWAVDLIND